MDQIISLYKEEIETYQQQIEDLKQRNRDCDQKNAALINKVQDLEDLVEKANVANRDLNLAFEHLHQENVKLQINAKNQDALAINHPKQVAETNNRGAEKLDAESLVWITEREQIKQRNGFLERECQRYHRDNMHLGKQVRHLITTLEQERGMIIRRQSQVTQENQLTCAADVIDQHLVTFESIEELQQKNQKLLSLVKNLSAEQEEREIRVESDEVKRLNTDLEQLKSQLDTIKNDRERVLQTLNTIHKERDLFSILLCKTRQAEHLTPEIFQRMVSVAVSSGPAIEGPDTSAVEREAHIDDLKRMISSLERNIESIKKEMEAAQIASADELRVKNGLLEKAHIKISEVMKTLETATERNEFLENNINALTTEFDDMRTKCQKMTLELEDSNRKIENAENQSKELAKSLDAERKRAQDALIEASQFKEQSQLLLESLEREKESRQRELTSLFNELQDRQTREFESRAEKQMELQQMLTRAYNDVYEIQLQRNYERARRIKLDKLLNGRPKPKNGRQDRMVTKFKVTKKHRPVRLSLPSSNGSFGSTSLMSTNASFSSPKKSPRKTFEEPIEQSPQEPLDEPLQESIQETLQEPVQEPVPEPEQEPMQELVQEPMQELVQEPMQEPVQEPMQELVQEPMQEPVQEPIQEPIQEPMQQPAQQPVQEPVLEPMQEDLQEPPHDSPQEQPHEQLQEPAQEQLHEPVKELLQELLQEPLQQPVQEPVQELQIKLKRRKLD